MGEPERIIVDSKGHSDYAQLENVENILDKIPSRGLTELDRLGWVVQNGIENCCQIVPQGSYKKNTLGEVKRNEAFNGLKLN